MKLNTYIDHTFLKPTVVDSDIVRLCEEAIQYQFAAVCVPPIYVEKAVSMLEGYPSAVCTVIGFPLGYEYLSTKIGTLKLAMTQGADELDAVVNISDVKNGNWARVESEIDTIATLIGKEQNKIFKLILETAYLTLEELEILCNLCLKYSVNYAKTSTGFAPAGASLEHVTFMRDILQDKVKIKASGGIRTKDFAMELIQAGATRLGTSSGVQLIQESV